MQSLTFKDYKTITDFYNLQIPSNTSFRKIKQIAEDILATKLCRCIKKVKKSKYTNDESKVIGICKNSILKKKNLHSYSFKCKKKPRFISKTGTRRKLMKLKRKNFTQKN
jgi:hypothetical protein